MKFSIFVILKGQNTTQQNTLNVSFRWQLTKTSNKGEIFILRFGVVWLAGKSDGGLGKVKEQVREINFGCCLLDCRWRVIINAET